MAKVSGKWQGRLLDAAGFEGIINLEMRGRGEKVSGTYDVALITQHGDNPRRGKLAGRLSEGKIALTLKPGSKTDPKIELHGNVFKSGQGLGLKGIYEIEQRKFSPLVRGIVCASSDRGTGQPETKIMNPEADRGKAKKPRRRREG